MHDDEVAALIVQFPTRERLEARMRKIIDDRDDQMRRAKSYSEAKSIDERACRLLGQFQQARQILSR